MSIFSNVNPSYVGNFCTVIFLIISKYTTYCPALMALLWYSKLIVIFPLPQCCGSATFCPSVTYVLLVNVHVLSMLVELFPSHFAAAVINAPTKATEGRKGLFSLLVSEGLPSIMMRRA